MDTTQNEDLLKELRETDAAAAPDVADELTAVLAEALEEAEPDSTDESPPEGAGAAS